MKISPAELKKAFDSNQPYVLIDVRRQSDFDEHPNVIPGAVWYDLDQINAWSQDIAANADVVVYCAHGKSRSQAAFDHILAMGINVKLLEGGFDGWRDADGAVVPPTKS